MRTIQRWHDQFSQTYKKLALGYNYLKNCKKVYFGHDNETLFYCFLVATESGFVQIDFEGMQAASQAEQRREAEEKRRRELLEQNKISAAKQEMDGRKFINQIMDSAYDLKNI